MTKPGPVPDRSQRQRATIAVLPAARQVQVAVPADALPFRVRAPCQAQLRAARGCLVLAPAADAAPVPAAFVALPAALARALAPAAAPDAVVRVDPPLASASAVCLSFALPASMSMPLSVPAPSVVNALALSSPHNPVLRIQCHACKSLLAPSSSSAESAAAPLFDNVADLPSEHWHEMLECWACHQEDYSHLLKKNHFGHVFPARRSSLLVSQSYLLVHENDILREAFLVGMTPLKANVSHDHDHNIEDADTNFDRKLSDQFVATHLYKHCVDIVLQSSVLHRSFSAYFADEICEAANSHASYKFRVFVSHPNERGRKTALLVWLLNWNMLLSHSTLKMQEIDNMSCEDLEPVVKIGFLPMDSGGEPWLFFSFFYVQYSNLTNADIDSSESKRQVLQEWEADKQVETISIEQEFHEHLLQELWTSNSEIVGLEQRKMGEFFVSHIRTCR
ncbi:hypothetical protein HDU82_008832 [Entophlyctis luteolus]|nr:hypothetical protein HDU82_008832 [Entophlyctis luteolus]